MFEAIVSDIKGYQILQRRYLLNVQQQKYVHY